MLRNALLDAFKNSTISKYEKEAERILQNDLVSEIDTQKSEDKIEIIASVISEDLYNQYSCKIDIDNFIVLSNRNCCLSLSDLKKYFKILDGINECNSGLSFFEPSLLKRYIYKEKCEKLYMSLRYKEIDRKQFFECFSIKLLKTCSLGRVIKILYLLIRG